ncbi:hypothetical protein GUA46_15225 [Muricauda sp. HICW]|uniref:Uncharacterized protein n=1 Tax=Flagellimonas chongwuensis TaxID=2697365 RepID=A0A850NN60_9FLAO|nr:hypothetical protein [Allomuricauda chongwuensis]NVN19698.1 hypothetical protein [Allomuricauda chongwuensis]
MDLTTHREEVPDPLGRDVRTYLGPARTALAFFVLNYIQEKRLQSVKSFLILKGKST